MVRGNPSILYISIGQILSPISILPGDDSTICGPSGSYRSNRTLTGTGRVKVSKTGE